jgi:hypothetical protein
MAFDDIFPETPMPIRMSERWIQGRLCLVRHDEDGTIRLERLISTNPDDYWDPDFQPNTTLD